MSNEFHLARLLGCTYPNSTCAAHQCKRVVPDQFGRARQFESDGICGKWANGVEFIGNTKNDTGSVSSIRNEGYVVRQQCELLIDSIP